MIRAPLPSLLICLPSLMVASIVGDVRSSIARKDFAAGEKLVRDYRGRSGVTPEFLEALSWLGRGALANRQLDKAEAYALETYQLSTEQLKTRALDAERRLPIALGAAIETRAHVLAARGERGEALGYLRQELEKFRSTSIRIRIQKNLHLLGLEGKPAPALEAREFLGSRPAPLETLKGRAVLLFFWAHWCGDCKGMAPALAKLNETYGGRGLTVVAPTQRYGYTARGEEAPPDKELAYIEQVRLKAYPGLERVPVPVSEENFRNYGASTTPTLVLIDPAGIVRMYHPGAMSHDELAPKVEGLLPAKAAQAAAPR